MRRRFRGASVPDPQALLFTGARDTEASILGLYTMVGATGELTLAAPDGTVRGTRSFTLAINTREEFNPVAAAFGVDPEPGDVVRVTVSTGSLQPYVNVLDLGTYDVAAFVPVQPLSDAIVPSAGVLVGANATSFVTDLFLSNPDPDTSCAVTVTYYPLYGPPTPLQQTVTLAPLETQAIENVLLALYGLTSGQGSLFLSSTLPVAAGVRVRRAHRRRGLRRVRARRSTAPRASPTRSGTAFGLPQTSRRRTNLLFYNRGLPGTVTVTGFSGRREPGGPGPGAARRPCARDASTRFSPPSAITNQPGGRIRVDVPEGMNVYAWTAAVDNQTGDLDLAAVQ